MVNEDMEESESGTGMSQGAGDETLGMRQVLGKVNLRDFAAMVASEFSLVTTSLRQATQSQPRSVPLALLPAVVRLLLLALVVVVFGSAILAITLIRGAITLVRRTSRD